MTFYVHTILTTMPLVYTTLPPAPFQTGTYLLLLPHHGLLLRVSPTGREGRVQDQPSGSRARNPVFPASTARVHAVSPEEAPDQPAQHQPSEGDPQLYVDTVAKVPL